MPKTIKTIKERLSYLSWSKMNMWEKDPNLFYQVYIEGLDVFKTRYLELGKRMATTLERGFDEEHDPLFEMVAILLPSYPKREFDVEATFEKIPLVGKLDGWNSSTNTIGEYKTGKLWTQSMADQSGQLTFYAMILWLKSKKIPQLRLHWAQTMEDAEGNLTLTGNTKTFITERRVRDFIVLSKRIKTAWQGIQEISKFNQ